LPHVPTRAERSKGDASPACANSLAARNKAGPNFSIAFSVSRCDGPATIRMPVLAWPGRRTGAAMALIPAA